MKNWIYILLILFSFCGPQVYGQQIEQLSLYNMNDYLLNPAVAGARNYFDVKAMNRHQWTGVQDAPRTFSLSLNGPFKNEKVGMGGYVFTDNAGPTRRTGAQISYAYHLQISEQLRLGVGLSAGLLQFAVDGSKITMTEAGDPALYGSLQSKTVFDAKIGTYLYHEKFYFGLTFPQILQNQVNLFDSDQPSANKLEDHYLITAGYRWDFSEDLSLEPSALFKYVYPAPLKYDLTLRLHYQNLGWVGASYRNNDAWVAMAGVQLKDRFSLAYAYDIGTSKMGQYASGSHEFVIGFRFNQ